MSDRERILASLRAVNVDAAELPTTAGDWLVFAEPRLPFVRVVESVGGRCEPLAGDEHVPDAIAELARSLGADVVHSEIDGPATDAGPDLAAVDLAVARGEIGVAENGAIWVSGAALRDRSVLFLAQHLALVIRADALVSNMHEAYARIDAAATPFGVFISGPSKTADIEQALVIGAHGPRSLTVFLVG